MVVVQSWFGWWINNVISPVLNWPYPVQAGGQTERQADRAWKLVKDARAKMVVWWVEEIEDGT